MEDTGVGGRIILKSIFKNGGGDMDLINLARGKNRWR